MAGCAPRKAGEGIENPRHPFNSNGAEAAATGGLPNAIARKNPQEFLTQIGAGAPS